MKAKPVCLAGEALPALLAQLLVVIAAVPAVAAAPQIVPGVTFQQSAVDLDKTNTFILTIVGDRPLAYQWRFNGMNLPNETNNLLVVGPAEPAHGGDYSVVVTNAFGAATSSPTRLWVTPRQTDFVKENYTNTTRSRLPYFYLLPSGYDTNRTYPLVYWLHGSPGDETMITNATGDLPGYGSYAALKVAASFRQQAIDPVILVWPARRSGEASVGWTPAYLQLLSGLLDQLLVRFSVDTNRVYVEGVSEGMHAAWDLLGMRPGFFAAARISAGWQGTYSAAAIKDVPIWLWCDSNDDAGQTANTRQAVRLLRQAGGNPIYTEYLTGGHMNGIGIGHLTPTFLDWMLAQRRGQSPTNHPMLMITNPAVAYMGPTGRTNTDLSGWAEALGEAVTSVTWTNFGRAWGMASGSNFWDISNVPLVPNKTNVVVVVATTTSWASAYGGNTTFNDAFTVVSSPIWTALVREGNNARLIWSGGAPPYQIQRATDLAADDWSDLLSDATSPAILPLESPSGFYRVVGQ